MSAIVMDENDAGTETAHLTMLRQTGSDDGPVHEAGSDGTSPAEVRARRRAQLLAGSDRAEVGLRGSGCGDKAKALSKLRSGGERSAEALSLGVKRWGTMRSPAPTDCPPSGPAGAAPGPAL